MRVEDVLQLFLLQMVSCCSAVVVVRRSVALAITDRLKHTDPSLVLRSTELVKLT